jgi:hypothetical protein
MYPDDYSCLCPLLSTLSAESQQGCYPFEGFLTRCTPLYARKTWLFAIPHKLGHLSTLHVFWGHVGLSGLFFMAFRETTSPKYFPTARAAMMKKLRALLMSFINSLLQL